MGLGCAVAGFAASSRLAGSLAGSAGEASTFGKAHAVAGSASFSGKIGEGLNHLDVDSRRRRRYQAPAA